LPHPDHKPHSPNLPAGLKATLVVTQGPQQGMRYHLARPEVKIGRRKDMDLILSDATVSSEHARIFVEEGGLWVEDLRSLNGTLVNDRRIQRAALQAKDKITVGKYVIEVELGAPAPGPAAPAQAPAPAGSLGTQPGFQQVWLAGYLTLEREVLIEVVEQTLSAHATAFANGEQLLTEFSARLGEGAGPDLIILNTRMPLISGPNTAIIIRAFEEGFDTTHKIPLGFLTSTPTPDPEPFLRVLKFCQPAAYLDSPPKIEEFRKQALNLIQSLAKPQA
jgi:CheY-like chemotaxis protein